MTASLSSRAAILGAILATLTLVGTAGAQSGRGFLFDEPNLTVGLRGGIGVANAGSDIFEFTYEELTVSESDFRGLSAFADVGYRLFPRMDLVASLGYVGSSIDSDSRDFIGSDDLPILQTTEFRRVPLTLGVRLYPLATGRQVGSYAWIPAKIVPYVGASAGGMWYRFRQSGEFVDAETIDDEEIIIFSDTFDSNGWTPTAEAFGGLQYSLTPRVSLTGEGRYSWARADLAAGAFENFEPIDLAGFAVTVGVGLRF